jgi:hypothetical protein
VSYAARLCWAQGLTGYLGLRGETGPNLKQSCSRNLGRVPVQMK